MRVDQVMNRDVVTVSPTTPLKEVASLLARRRISGVPVCDAGGVVGVVSEADILWKELGVSEGGGGWVEGILESAYGDKGRVAAGSAGEAMTAPAIVVAPQATIPEAAKLMIECRVNRLPVVEDGKLVGIVARSDLVRAFTRTDEEIKGEIRDDVLLHTLWIEPFALSLVVLEGDVTVGGEVENRSTAALVEGYIRRVPGVVAVHSHVSWKIDDLARRTRASANHLPSRI